MVIHFIKLKRGNSTLNWEKFYERQNSTQNYNIQKCCSWQKLVLREEEDYTKRVKVGQFEQIFNQCGNYKNTHLPHSSLLEEDFEARRFQ